VQLFSCANLFSFIFYNGNKGMLCGILEGNDGSIWFGSEKEVYRYDRKTITDFKTMVIHIRQQFRAWSEQH